MSNLRLDPDFYEVVSAIGAVERPVAKDVHTLRAFTNATLAMLSGNAPDNPSVQETTLHFTARDGTTLPIYKFTLSAPKHDQSKPQPATIFVHGGGMVSGSVALFKPTITQYVAATGVVIYAVGYRLAPEFPFPTPVQDVYDALEWLRGNSATENVDPARIGICGASAGGGIAAGVVLMARDKGLTPPLARQILIYPMLDDRTTAGPDHAISPFLTWTSWNNSLGWNAYVGTDRSNVSPYAAPARATDVSGLPRTYIDVGGLDLFRDESIAYAAKLAAANIDVELHLFPGVPHGWEWVAPDIPVTRKAEEHRIAALSDF